MSCCKGSPWVGIKLFWRQVRPDGFADAAQATGISTDWVFSGRWVNSHG